MPCDVVQPFESIESAQEFMALLETVIADATGELEMRRAESKSERYIRALDLALYQIHQLSSHVQKSRRILNNLTLIRGVLTGPARAGDSAQGDDSEPPTSVVGASA
jgi:hypothetical protein